MVGNIQQSIQALQQNSALAQQTAGVGLSSSLVQGQYGYTSAVGQAQGVEAQLLLQQISDAANIEIDNISTVAKDGLLLAGKAMEMSTLVAQTREKVMGMFASITEARTANTWGNIKKLTQGFKF
jgi:hypothetical protein